MAKERKKKIKRRKVRSFKKLKLFLLAFGLTGVAIGLALCGYFTLKGNWKLVACGFGYILFSCAALGWRGILIYLDELRKEKRHRRKST